MIHVILTVFFVGLFHSTSFADVKFKDNVVRLSPNFGTGSSTEATTRILAPFLSESLPGNPKVIVEPIEGGGGTKLARNLLKERGDGHRAGVLAILHITASLGRPMPIALNKLKNVGSFAFPTIIMVRKNLGLNDLQDVINYKKEIIIAASKPNAPGVSPLRTWLIANNVNHRIVTGYAGQPACVAALQAGEVDVTPLNAQLFMPMRKTYEENGAIPLVQNGLLNPAGGPDLKVDIPGKSVMSIDESWKKFTPGTVDSNEYTTFRFIQKSFPMVMHWAMSPDTPDEYLQVWRKSFLALFKSDGFKKYLEKTNSPTPVVISGEQVDETVKSLDQAKNDKAIQSVVKRLKKKTL